MASTGSKQHDDEVQQARTFFLWVNSYLRKVDRKLDDITQLGDGLSLIALMETLSGKLVNGGKYSKNPRIRVQVLENTRLALVHTADAGIKVTASAENFCDGNKTMILGFVWLLICRFQLGSPMEKTSSSAEASGAASESTGNATEESAGPDRAAAAGGSSAAEELLAWARRTLVAYTDLKMDGTLVEAFADGRAFCALCETLGARGFVYASQVASGSDVGNRAVAYEAAETEFDIPQLLDSESVPDTRSLLTYLSYFRTAEAHVRAHQREVAERQAVEARAREADAALRAKDAALAAMEAQMSAMSQQLSSASLRRQPSVVAPGDGIGTQTEWDWQAELTAKLKSEHAVELAAAVAEKQAAQAELVRLRAAAQQETAERERELATAKSRAATEAEAARAAREAADAAKHEAAAREAETAAALKAANERAAQQEIDFEAQLAEAEERGYQRGLRDRSGKLSERAMAVLRLTAKELAEKQPLLVAEADS